MDRRKFIAGCTALLAASCARDEQRPKAYDEKECPFCTTDPGVCFGCKGTGKCTFCNGTGKRVTAWTDNAEEKIKKGSYEDTCSYCKGTGTCRYCEGHKKCAACKGTGKIESWDFFEKSKQTKK